MDLVIHIGLPKTGTTTIQNHLLAGTPGYLGKDKRGRCLTGDRTIAEALRQLAFKTRYLEFAKLQRQGREWVHRVTCAAQGINIPTLTLSEEGLSHWPVSTASRQGLSGVFHPSGQPVISFGQRSRPRPLVRLLREHIVPLWHTLGAGEVKVLLTLRNQPQWLASNYAQRSVANPRASQSDFESQIRSLLAANDPYIDWASLVEAMAHTVGNNNLLTLLHEEIDHPRYWDDLASFLDLDGATREAPTPEKAPKENVRADEAPDAWRVRPLELMHQYLKRRWGKVNLSQRHRISRKAVRRLDAVTLAQVHRHKRDHTIRLTDELRSEIREQCAPSNHRLGEMLGRDLTPLGY